MTGIIVRIMRVVVTEHRREPRDGRRETVLRCAAQLLLRQRGEETAEGHRRDGAAARVGVVHQLRHSARRVEEPSDLLLAEHDAERALDAAA